MRKALTVLLLMVAVMGLAFAGNDETSQENTTSNSNTITLMMFVGEKPPVFNLRTSTESGVIVSTNSGSSIPFHNGANYYGTVLALSDDISTKDITQTFEIFSASKANYIGGFEFTVEAEPFRTQENVTGTTYETKGPISYNYSIETVPEGSDLAFTCGDRSITAYFNGLQVSSNVKIGQIVVTWPRDASAIPADYYSDVTMTIKSTN